MTQYLITAGCSFTAGTSNLVEALKNPHIWPHFLFQKINSKILINLAIPGGSNRQIANNLIYLLETKKYISPSDSLIGINFTGLDRIDVMCAVDHPDANKYFSWTKEFKFGWITHGGFLDKHPPFNGSLQKNMELAQIQLENCLAIVSCLSYLKLQGFKFVFMLMHDDIIVDSPTWFQNILTEEYADNYVTLENQRSMHAFAKSKNLLNADNFHPNEEAHKLISEHVNNFLCNKENTHV